MEEPQLFDEAKHSVEAPAKEKETRKLTGIKVNTFIPFQSFAPPPSFANKYYSGSYSTSAP